MKNIKKRMLLAILSIFLIATIATAGLITQYGIIRTEPSNVRPVITIGEDEAWDEEVMMGFPDDTLYGGNTYTLVYGQGSETTIDIKNYGDVDIVANFVVGEYPLSECIEGIWILIGTDTYTLNDGFVIPGDSTIQISIQVKINDMTDFENDMFFSLNLVPSS